eukprot:gene13026-biopygen8456
MWTHPPGLPRRLPCPALASMGPNVARGPRVCVPPTPCSTCLPVPTLRWAPCGLLDWPVVWKPHVPHVDSPPRPAQTPPLPCPGFYGAERGAGSKDCKSCTNLLT